MCHECCLNFVTVNKDEQNEEESKAKDVNHAKIFEKQVEKSADILRAIAIAEAGKKQAAGPGPSTLQALACSGRGGGAAAQQRCEQIAKTCAAYDAKGRVRRCTRCKSMGYCGKET
jgi:hypothetical protein